jgi:hypothetical protein
MRFGLAVLAYVLPTFALGFVWHLVLFEAAYDGLGVYRDDLIIPFGFASMLIQGILFAFLFRHVLAGQGVGWIGRGIAFAAIGGVLSWSYTGLAVAART